MLQSGVQIAGRFEIEELAATGGMGMVFRARDHHDGSAVALKLMAAPGAAAEARFVREAQLLAELRHPGIVRYVAHGTTPTGELFLATEWIEGESLAARLERQGLTMAESVALARTVAGALAVVHARGVVHRDLKPSNLLLPGGVVHRAKLLDFGVAHLAHATRAATRTGAVLGTPGYLAPEQARGELGIDARADVFALGCVLFECVTGRPAFAAEGVLALLAKILVDDAPRASRVRAGVPAALDDALGLLLAKDRAARPHDGAAALALLDALPPLDGDVPAQEAPPPTALTAAELRFKCVLLVRPPGGELRRLAMAPTLTPDQLGPGPIASPLETLATRFGGRLERLADGGAALTFNGAGAATDKATQAARASLALRKVWPTTPVALAMGRAGAEPFAVGEAIERAARLLRAGGPDRGVRIDDVVAGLLDARFELGGDELGAMLLGERPAELARTLLGRATPFVGRETELAVLQGLVAQAVDEPMARAALVTGAAGAGKSRLRWELLGRLRAERPELEILVGRGDPMSAGAPFALLGGALRRLAGILDGEPTAVRWQKLVARLGRHVPEAERARVLGFLGELAGVPSSAPLPLLGTARHDAQVMRDELRRAFLDWLEVECAAAPVVLVLEDLHWGDLPTVKLVDAALRALADRPLVVLALGRPDVHEVFPGLWSSRPVHELRLGELPRRAAARLVRAVLGETLAPGFVERLVSRAAGNAFYLEELIRATAEGRGGELPATVLAMLQARLERLPPPARRVLRAASLFGAVCWADGVTALLGPGADPAATGEWLELLAEQEILTRHAEARFPGKLEYAFRHVLMRDAAYRSLTESDAVLGHRLAAAWLADAGEPDATILAEHCERGGEAAAAVAHYRRAAEAALDGDDLGGALTLVERGLNAASLGGADDATIGALLALEAEAHRWRSENPAAERAALEARRRLSPAARTWWDATADLVVAAGRLGNRERLTALAEELLALDWRAAPPEAAAVGARLAGQLLFQQQGALADALLARAVDMHALPPGVRAAVTEAAGFRAYLAGDLGVALDGLVAAGHDFAAAGQQREAALLGVNLAYLQIGMGEVAAAEVTLRAALATAVRLGLPNLASVAQQNLALSLLQQDRLDEAAEQATASVRAFEGQADRRMLATSRAYLAEIQLRRGEIDAALASAEAAYAEAPTSASRAIAVAVRARALLCLGRAGDALAAAEEGMAFLPKGVDEGEAVLRLALAEALLAAGRPADAEAAARAAATWLWGRAARISDPGRHAGFLGVAEHARLLALARAAGADAAATRR